MRRSSLRLDFRAVLSFFAILTFVAAQDVPPYRGIADCPAGNQTDFITIGGSTYKIECGWEHASYDLPQPNGINAGSFELCMDRCDSRAGCVYVAWARGGGACYMKSRVGNLVYNSGIWGAIRLGGGSAVPSPISSTLSSSRSSSMIVGAPSSSSAMMPLPSTSSAGMPMQPSTSSAMAMAASSSSARWMSSSHAIILPSSSSVWIMPSSSSAAWEPMSSSPQAMSSSVGPSMPGPNIVSSSPAADGMGSSQPQAMSSSTPMVISRETSATMRPASSSQRGVVPAPSSSSPQVIIGLPSSSSIRASILPSIGPSSARESMPNMASSTGIVLIRSSSAAMSSMAPAGSPSMGGSPTLSAGPSMSSAAAFSTVAVDLNRAYPNPLASILRDGRTGTTYAEFKPDTNSLSVSLTIPVNGTSTSIAQRLVFSLANDGYYFGSKKQKRQIPSCMIQVFYDGVQVFTMDSADLFAEYQQFTSDSITPSSPNTVITFTETCPYSTTFPTLLVSGVSIQYEGVLSMSSGAAMSTWMASSASIGQSIGASILGSLTMPPNSLSIMASPGSAVSSSRTRRTITVTTYTHTGICSARSIRTIFTTISNCPATCSASGMIRSSMSAMPSGTCLSSLSGSLCYDCYLSPTVVVETCVGTSTTPSAWASSWIPTTTWIATGTRGSIGSSSRAVSTPGPGGPGGPGSGDPPNCPFEQNGRLYIDPLGRIYAIYCGTVYDDAEVSSVQGGGLGALPLLEKRQAGSELSESRLFVSSFTDCMTACDNFNIVHFKSGSPCKGVSYKPGTDSPNCFLKASTNMVRYVAGFDSAKLITLDPLPENNTQSESSVVLELRLSSMLMLSSAVTTTVISFLPGSMVYTGGGGDGTVTLPDSVGVNPGVTATVSGGKLARGNMNALADPSCAQEASLHRPRWPPRRRPLSDRQWYRVVLELFKLSISLNSGR